MSELDVETYRSQNVNLLFRIDVLRKFYEEHQQEEGSEHERQVSDESVILAEAGAEESSVLLSGDEDGESVTPLWAVASDIDSILNSTERMCHMITELVEFAVANSRAKVEYVQSSCTGVENIRTFIYLEVQCKSCIESFVLRVGAELNLAEVLTRICSERIPVANVWTRSLPESLQQCLACERDCGEIIEKLRSFAAVLADGVRLEQARSERLAENERLRLEVERLRREEDQLRQQVEELQALRESLQQTVAILYHSGEEQQQAPPLSDAEIDGIPLCRYELVDQLESESGGPQLIMSTSCSVCLVDFALGDELRVFNCLHRFHRCCAEEWLKVKGSCPVCRRRVLAS